MTLLQAVQSCYSKYATFTGRARRSEFWYFVLFQFLVVVLLAAAIFALGQNVSAGIFGVLFVCFAAASVLPSLAVRVRRLHDTNRSGWMIFIGIIPLVGPILILVWDCQPGTHGPNRFGDDPLADGTAEVFS